MKARGLMGTAHAKQDQDFVYCIKLSDTLQFLFAAAMGVMKAMAFIDEQ
jgi:hypothetical protein